MTARKKPTPSKLWSIQKKPSAQTFAVRKRERQRAEWKKRVRAAVRHALADDSVTFLMFAPTDYDASKIEVFANITDPHRLLVELQIAQGRIVWELSSGQAFVPLLPLLSEESA